MFFFLKHLMWFVRAFTGIDLLILHSHLGQGLHQEAFAFPAAGLWAQKSSWTSCTAKRRRWGPCRENLMREIWRQVSTDSIREVSLADLNHWLPFSDTLLILTLLTQRYVHYINTGVPSSVLAPQPHQQMMNIMSLLPPNTEDSDKHLQIMRANLEAEVKRDYDFSLKKSIGIKQWSVCDSLMTVLLYLDILNICQYHFCLHLLHSICLLCLFDVLADI